MSNKKEKVLFFLILAFSLIAGIIFILFTQNSFGGGDSTTHYSLAHWGWKYPELLFNHWGKPVFTILISPFAQFGINGARFYNLLMGIATGVLVWKIAQKLRISNAYISIIFVLFTPIYFALMFTPLTEVTYSFFITLSILLFFNKKYILSAFILSFTPLIRTEGIVLLPLFIFAYLLKRRYFAILVISSGFWIVSLLGYWHYDDYWWLITKMPYSGNAKDIYGSGSFFHFINNSRGILGYPIWILFLIGLLVAAYNWIKHDKNKVSDQFLFLILIPGSYVVFIAAHSYVWWQGMGNSLGLIRVIGSVSPLAALTALIGLNFIFSFLYKKHRIAGIIFMSGTILWIIVLGIRTHKYHYKLSPPQQLLIQACDSIKKENLQEYKLYYFNTFIPYYLDIDPFDNSVCQFGVNNVENPSIGLPDSSLIIWDAHFGPNEGRVSIESLGKQPNLELIKSFSPKVPFTVLGGYNYEVRIYRKNNSLNKSLLSKVFYNFEEGEYISNTVSHSGTSSRHMSPKDLYSNGMIGYLEEMIDTPSPFEISVSGYIYSENEIPDELPLVCALYDEVHTLYYKTENLKNQVLTSNQWNRIDYTFKIPKVNSLDKLLKVFIWNKNNYDFYIDDLTYQIHNVNNRVFDFEHSENGYERISHSGQKSLHIKNDNLYSEVYEVLLADLFDSTCKLKVDVSGYINVSYKLSDELPLICSIENNDTLDYYKTYDLRNTVTETNSWLQFENTFNIGDINTPEGILKVYIWNKNQQEFYLDDFSIKIISK